ncbi:MAG: hypothetical protein Q8Q33_08900 [Chlamydiota bacterium]|nr:hypothetical protein [Chlamydiota bacterium]
MKKLITAGCLLFCMSSTLHAQPAQVVADVLNSTINITDNTKEEQIKRMELFNQSILKPSMKQKIFFWLIFTKIQDFRIINEDLYSEKEGAQAEERAKVEVDVKGAQEKQKVFFYLVYRKKQWWIESFVLGNEKSIEKDEESQTEKVSQLKATNI